MREGNILLFPSSIRVSDPPLSLARSGFFVVCIFLLFFIPMSHFSDNIAVDTGFDASVYHETSLHPGKPSMTVHGEKDLWCTVILQAFIDVGAVTPPTAVRRKEGGLPALPAGKRYNDAAHWLLYDMQDFPYICTLAGVSPSVIRRAARHFCMGVQA